MSAPNGCGPEGYGWLVPEGPEGRFNKPCIEHDKKYRDGYTEESRLSADWQLFKDCIKAMSNLKWYKKLWGYPLAVLYLIGVTTIGWAFYNYKEPS